MQTYTIRLSGPGVAADPQRLPGRLVSDLLEAVDRNAKGAVRLRLEGRSTAGGPVPGWVRRAARFDLVGLLTVGPGVVISAPVLREALAEKFTQETLFADPDADRSAISLMTEGLDAALHGRTDTEAYDDSLLHSFANFSAVLQHDVETVEIRNGNPNSPCVTITPQGLQVVEQLHQATPQPRRVRIAGKLDAMRFSDRAFTLVLPTGKAIRGILADGDAEALTPFFGRMTLVSGFAHFRPSGALSRIEAEHIEVGSERDLKMWAAIPRPLEAALELNERSRGAAARSGLASIYGKWPGEETDEELLALLDDLS